MTHIVETKFIGGFLSGEFTVSQKLACPFDQELVKVRFGAEAGGVSKQRCETGMATPNLRTHLGKTELTLGTASHVLHGFAHLPAWQLGSLSECVTNTNRVQGVSKQVNQNLQDQ